MNVIDLNDEKIEKLLNAIINADAENPNDPEQQVHGFIKPNCIYLCTGDHTTKQGDTIKKGEMYAPYYSDKGNLVLSVADSKVKYGAYNKMYWQEIDRAFLDKLAVALDKAEHLKKCDNAYVITVEEDELIIIKQPKDKADDFGLTYFKSFDEAKQFIQSYPQIANRIAEENYDIMNK